MECCTLQHLVTQRSLLLFYSLSLYTLTWNSKYLKCVLEAHIMWMLAHTCALCLYKCAYTSFRCIIQLSDALILLLVAIYSAYLCVCGYVLLFTHYGVHKRTSISMYSVLLAHCMPFNSVSYIPNSESQPCT